MLPVLRAQHARQRHRRARAQVERERLAPASIGLRVNTATVATSPSEAIDTSGTMRVVAAQVLDRRDQPEVDLALVQQRRALRRHVEAHVELIGMGIEPVDQRLRIEIRNRAKPKRRVMRGEVSLRPA